MKEREGIVVFYDLPIHFLTLKVLSSENTFRNGVGGSLTFTVA